jgi:tetratricopeptide (TPR) repeat protein
VPKLTSAYHSKIYRGFKEIEPDEHLSLVRYYETYEDEIKLLDFTEFFELLIAYIEALFEVGAYQNHSLMVDAAIEISITNNIKFYNKKDIYCELLFKKAASYYNLMRYDEAQHILRELIKINPQNEISIRFLNKCMLRKKPKFIRNAQALSILLFLLAALIISIELVFIRPLFEMHTSTVELARNTIFFFGIVILTGSEIVTRVNVKKQINSFVTQARKKKILK